MTSTNANEVSTSTPSNGEATKATRKRKTANRKTASKQTASGSKVDQARKIFDRMAGKKSRKEVIESFVSDAGLTPAGAGTYYQRFSAGNGSSNQGKQRSARGKSANSMKAKGASKRGRPVGSTSPDSKAEKAREIFKSIGKRAPRKEVIEAFMDKAKLTQAGASTYYQKLKSAA